MHGAPRDTGNLRGGGWGGAAAGGAAHAGANSINSTVDRPPPAPPPPPLPFDVVVVQLDLHVIAMGGVALAAALYALRRCLGGARPRSTTYRRLNVGGPTHRSLRAASFDSPASSVCSSPPWQPDTMSPPGATVVQAPAPIVRSTSSGGMGLFGAFSKRWSNED